MESDGGGAEGDPGAAGPLLPGAAGPLLPGAAGPLLPGAAELLQRANRRWSAGPGLAPLAGGRPLRGAESDLRFSTCRLRVRVVEWADGEVGVFAAEIGAPESAFEGQARPPGAPQGAPLSFEALEGAANREGGRRVKFRPGAGGGLELFLGPFAEGAFAAVEGWAPLERVGDPARAAALSAALDLADRDLDSDDEDDGNDSASG